MATTIGASSAKKPSELAKEAGVTSFSSTPKKSPTILYGSVSGTTDPKEQARVAAYKETAAKAAEEARKSSIEGQYEQRQADAEKLYNQRQQEARTTYDQRQAAANATFDQRNQQAQQTYDQRTQQAQNVYNQRQQAAQDLYTQRQNEAQATYDQRLGASQGKITDLYAKQLAAQQQQLKTGLDKSIAAQEEARAKIAPQYQTAANDLAVQYERNRRNLNMQALAQGLNTGTGSQQQLALNQGFARGFAGLRAQEIAENASIERQIANLKVDYQNAVSQAMADNDYKKAAALMDDYNNQLNWLDQRQAQNQSHLDSQSAAALSYLDSLNAQNQSRYDSMTDANRNYLDSITQQNQSRLDTVGDKNATRFDATSDANRNWADSQIMNRAQTLATYGDFSGYAAIYGQNTANTMKEMWIAQNPDMAYRTGQIDAERYREMTGAYPAGVDAGGGGGGGWYGGGGGGAGGGGDNDTITPTGNNAQEAAKAALAGATTRGQVARATQQAVSTGAISRDAGNAIIKTLH